MPKSPKRDRGAARREVHTERHRSRSEATRAGRVWLPWASPLYWAGNILALGTLVGAAMGAKGALILGSLSVVGNLLASYAMRKASAVAPQRFPMVFQAEVGRIRGVTYCMVLAFISGIVAWFGFESLYL